MATANWPKTLLQATRYFADPDVCLKAAIEFRWQGGPVTCPTCGSTDVHFISTRRVWRCKGATHARQQFSVKVGTIMEDSPIALDKWMVAIWLITNAKNGISSYELHRAIGITQKSAWFMLHRIRLILQDDSDGPFSGNVELDETFIGGKARNMHFSKRKRMGITQGRSMAGKVAVMGLLERTSAKGKSRVRVARVASTKRRHLMPHVLRYIEKGATVHTDSLPSYVQLVTDYTHKVIDHAEAYVDGTVHTNGLENFWSLLKRTIRGTYVSVEPFHLFRYLDEQAYRFNLRGLNDSQRFVKAAQSIIGRRLTYKALTGHDLSESPAF
jgi:transposase-like protein